MCDLLPASVYRPASRSILTSTARARLCVPNVYRVSRLETVVASLVCPQVMPVTCGSGKAAGQRVAQALICKQGVGGSSPLVSTG
jgi:hypothetical protein